MPPKTIEEKKAARAERDRRRYLGPEGQKKLKVRRERDKIREKEKRMKALGLIPEDAPSSIPTRVFLTTEELKAHRAERDKRRYLGPEGQKKLKALRERWKERKRIKRAEEMKPSGLIPNDGQSSIPTRVAQIIDVQEDLLPQDRRKEGEKSKMDKEKEKPRGLLPHPALCSVPTRVIKTNEERKARMRELEREEEMKAKGDKLMKSLRRIVDDPVHSPAAPLVPRG